MLMPITKILVNNLHFYKVDKAYNLAFSQNPGNINHIYQV